MDNKVTDLLSFCSQIDFGTVNLSQEEEKFRGELNREMLTLCQYLPKSMRTEAALFLVEYLHTSFIGCVNFVNYFYAPAWSIIFWLHRFCPENRKINLKMKDAKAGHVMAMFLHALDDHITDGQLPVTHLTLLMRSQSWMIMNQAFKRLAKGVDQGAAIVSDFINDYYSSIGKSDETESLDSYCKFFRKQMATWLIVPVLMAKRMSADEEFSRSIQSAYCSFGIAWRLLDDLQDIEKDMMRGVHSSIYVCLNENLRGWWDKDPEEKKDQNNGYVQTILSYLLENKVIDSIKERACSELVSAVSIADSCSMSDLAGELRCLLKPLRNGQNRS
jgi:hypothetical protein